MKELSPPVGVYDDPRCALELLKKPRGGKEVPFGVASLRFTCGRKENPSPGVCVYVYVCECVFTVYVCVRVCVFSQCMRCKVLFLPFDVCVVAHFPDAPRRRGRSHPDTGVDFLLSTLVLLTESETKACLLPSEPCPAARKHVFPFKPLQNRRVA